MASRSLALCFFAFYGQTRIAAVYHTQLPGDCTLSLKPLERSTLKDMPAGLNTAFPQQRLWRKSWGQGLHHGAGQHTSAEVLRQLDRSVTWCCMWLMHSTVTSSGCTGVELHLCKSFRNHQREERSKEQRSLNCYFTFSIASRNLNKEYVSNFCLSTSDYCLIQGGGRTASNPKVIFLFWEVEHAESLPS